LLFTSNAQSRAAAAANHGSEHITAGLLVAAL